MNITANDYFYSCAIKAIRSKNHNKRLEIFEGLLSRTFSPITNKVKLANGQRKYQLIETIKAIAVYNMPSHLMTLVADNIITGEEAKLIHELIKQIRINRLDRKYVIVYVAQYGVTPEQQLVQASHVIHRLGLSEDRGNVNKEEPYFWVFGNESNNLNLESAILTKNGFKHVTWREPDLENRMTAIALYPIGLAKSRFFEQEKLLKFN